jgi:hypothetical protein
VNAANLTPNSSPINPWGCLVAYVHSYDPRTAPWSRWRRSVINMGLGRGTHGRRGGIASVQEIQNPRINTVHALSHILCMVLRLPKSCTIFVTCSPFQLHGGVTNIRTYIHLAIGSAFMLGV